MTFVPDMPVPLDRHHDRLDHADKVAAHHGAHTSSDHLGDRCWGAAVIAVRRVASCRVSVLSVVEGGNPDWIDNLPA